MKAILVCVDVPVKQYSVDYSLDELESLANTLDIETAGRLTQKLTMPTNNYYLGKGKVEELKLLIESLECDIVIFDDELSPTQLKNLEDKLDIIIMDRTYLILDIFLKRAKTNEAILEIKLAKNKYLLPRLKHLHKNLQSQTGASGSYSSKGPGEKQSELDRRQIANEIVKLEKELEKTKKMKETQINKRKQNEMFSVALVGYTNVGKSSLLNSVIDYSNINKDKQVLQKDELFATLSTFTRQIRYNKNKFLMVDTVGLVSKLPPNLVNSFISTLEEIKNADLLLVVIDPTNQYYDYQTKIVFNVLSYLESNTKDIIYVYTKKDLYNNTFDVNWYPSVFVSNVTNEGIKDLLDDILRYKNKDIVYLDVVIPINRYDLIRVVEETTEVLLRNSNETDFYYKLKTNKKNYNLLVKYDFKSIIANN